MRDWIGANLVLLAIALSSALILFFGVTLVRSIGLGDTAERVLSVVIGFVAVGVSVYAARSILSRKRPY